MEYYKQQLDELYDSVFTLAQELSAEGYQYQASQLDMILDLIEEIDFEEE